MEELLSMHPEFLNSPDFDSLLQEILIQEQRARLTAETLLRATAAINSTLELKQVLDQILEQLQQVLRFYSASVLLIEEDKASILAVRGHPHPEAALKVAFSPAEDLLTKEIISHQEPIVITDARLDPRFTCLGEANYVRGWMADPFFVEGLNEGDGQSFSQTIPLTVSVGAAAFPDYAHDPRELVAAADLALYQAKAAGRNCVVLATL